MNAMKLFSIAILFVGFAAKATSLHPDTFRQVAPVLTQVPLIDVEGRGEVLKITRSHPYTRFLIGIPAKVNVMSACLDFVGQQTKLPVAGKQMVEISALAAQNPLVDACIEIAVSPIATQLTLEMEVLTGGFVPADDVQIRLVRIQGAGEFHVRLDMSNDTVTIKRVFKRLN